MFHFATHAAHSFFRNCIPYGLIYRYVGAWGRGGISTRKGVDARHLSQGKRGVNCRNVATDCAVLGYLPMISNWFVFFVAYDCLSNSNKAVEYRIPTFLVLPDN